VTPPQAIDYNQLPLMAMSVAILAPIDQQTASTATAAVRQSRARCRQTSQAAMTHCTYGTHSATGIKPSQRGICDQYTVGPELVDSHPQQNSSQAS